MRCSTASLVAVLAMLPAAPCDASAVASGRNWRISIERLECDAAASMLAIGLRIRYLGVKGPVEAPLSYLSDGEGRRHAPRSLVWRAGSKQHAGWLSAGGLSNLQSDNIGEFQLNFDLRDAAADLRLEFGDIPALSLTRNRQTGSCRGVLVPDQVQAPRVARRAVVEKSALRIYRAAYPCSARSGPRTVEASHPPHLPRQLLLFGRGYLPNAREVELPMGKAPAQSYVYAGPEDLKPIDDATRRAVTTDFPEYVTGGYFVFSWGEQKTASGNAAHSVGIYDVRPCRTTN